jgi:hypothetical protein
VLAETGGTQPLFVAGTKSHDWELKSASAQISCVSCDVATTLIPAHHVGSR